MVSLILLVLFIFTPIAYSDTTSRYHRYRIDHACDVASSTFVPYSGIRIQQARYANLLRGDLGAASRKMRASVCMHGSRYTQAYAEYNTSVATTDWVDWSAKFCFTDQWTPLDYRGCYIMIKTHEYQQTLQLLMANRPAGLLYKCESINECNKPYPFATLVSDEAYMAWDRPRDAVNQTAIRIPLMYTAELFSDQHLRNTEVLVLCTKQFGTSKAKEPGPRLVRRLMTVLDAALGLRRSKAVTLEALNDKLVELFMLRNKRVAKKLMDKLAVLVEKYT